MTTNEPYKDCWNCKNRDVTKVLTTNPPKPCCNLRNYCYTENCIHYVPLNEDYTDTHETISPYEGSTFNSPYPTKITTIDTTTTEYDPVNHPSHYCEGRKYEPIKVIDDWGLDFYLGNALKYISRAGRKNDELEDLKKARFYLDYKIKYLEAKK